MTKRNRLFGLSTAFVATFVCASLPAHADQDMEAGRPRQTMTRYQAVEASVQYDYDDSEAYEDYDYSSYEASAYLGDAEWEESAQERSAGVSVPSRIEREIASSASAAGQSDGRLLQEDAAPGSTVPPCAR